MCSVLIFVFCIFGSQVVVYFGYLGELVGYDYWVVGVVIGLVILFGLCEVLKGCKDKLEEIEEEVEGEEVFV